MIKIKMKNVFKMLSLSVAIVISMCIFVNKSSAYEVLSSFKGDRSKEYISIFGSDRYETSLKVSNFTYNRSTNAIIVDGKSYISSISSSLLSLKLKAPILLNKSDYLSNENINEISRLGVKKVFLIGENISKNIVDKLNRLDIEVVEITGNTPFELSVNVNNFIGKNEKMDKIILASSNNFADSIAISSYAAKKGVPMFLVERDIDQQTVDKINSYQAKEVIVVGGDSTIGQESVNKIINAKRISGVDRYETSKIVHNEFYPNSKKVVVASGKNFADTVSAIPLSHEFDSDIMLVKNSAEELFDLHFQKVIAVGGKIKKYTTGVVYINPHQDDETLDMGLDIIRDIKDGREVYLILMTDGSKSRAYESLEYKLFKAKKSKISRGDFVYIRNLEMKNALSELGLNEDKIINMKNLNLDLTKEEVTNAIKKFEDTHGKNFSYKTLAKNEFDASEGRFDHFACHDAVKEFSESNGRNATFFSSKPNKDSDSSKIIIKYPNNEEVDIWKRALKKYGNSDFDNGTYAVGYSSVRGAFEAKIKNTEEYVTYE